MTNPVDIRVPDGNKPTGDMRLILKSAGVSMTVAEAQGYDLADYDYIFCKDTRKFYVFDAMSEAVDDDGLTTIIDAAGSRFIKRYLGNGIQSITALTEAEYAAIVTPDENTIYFVKE